MPFVHLASQRLATRALAAAALLERGTTEAEREAAGRLTDLLRRQGVVAVPLEIHPGGPEARMSDDGLLFVRDTVWWPGLLLCGLAPCYGFDAAGKPIQVSPAGAWRVWIVWPPAAVESLRLSYAAMCLLGAFASRRHRGPTLSLNRLMIGMVIGMLGVSSELGRAAANGRAIVVWSGVGQDAPVMDGGSGPPVPAKPPVDGEGAKQLRSFAGLQAFMSNVVDEGVRIGAIVFGRFSGKAGEHGPLTV